ncbi:hypothetical protein HN51_001753 [Arachis hypogaea]
MLWEIFLRKSMNWMSHECSTFVIGMNTYELYRFLSVNYWTNKLSVYEQRLYGFAICFSAGLTFTLLSMLVFLKPIKLNSLHFFFQFLQQLLGFF